MKTLLTIAIIALSITLPAQDSSYKAGEFSVDVFGGLKSPDLDAERTSYGVGVQYYLTANLGAGVYTSLENLSGHTFDNVSFRGLWRVPIQKHAFYFFAGVTRQLHVSSEEIGWSGQLGPGYEYRPIEHVGLFSEIGIDKVWTGDERPVSATVRGGIRFTF